MNESIAAYKADVRGVLEGFDRVVFPGDAQFISYPQLVDHAMKRLDRREAMRFLGRRSNRRFTGELSSDIRVHRERICIKHRVEENSIKMYDKQGSVLRIENTFNHPKRLKLWRKVKRQGQSVMR